MNRETDQPTDPWRRNGEHAVLPCEDIQAVLLDYLTRELGPGRSDLVREHLRKCPTCQSAAADMQATLDFLHRDSAAGAGLPERLSDTHRARIVRALMHPVLDWIYRHHVAVSVAAAIVIVLTAVGLLVKARILDLRGPGPGYRVRIGPGPEAAGSPERPGGR